MLQILQDCKLSMKASAYIWISVEYVQEIDYDKSSRKPMWPLQTLTAYIL